MIIVMIRSLLGTAGSALLDWYIANSVWVNLLVLGYALLLLLGRSSYAAMKSEIQTQLSLAYGQDLGSKSAEWFAKTLQKQPLDWPKIIASSKFPLLTPPKWYFFRLRNQKSVMELFSPSVIASWYQPKPTAQGQ